MQPSLLLVMCSPMSFDRCTELGGRHHGQGPQSTISPDGSSTLQSLRPMPTLPSPICSRCCGLAFSRTSGEIIQRVALGSADFTQQNAPFDQVVCGSEVSSLSLLSHKDPVIGNFLAVQWLGLRASTSGGTGSIPGRGTEILHAV